MILTWMGRMDTDKVGGRDDAGRSGGYAWTGMGMATSGGRART